MAFDTVEPRNKAGAMEVESGLPALQIKIEAVLPASLTVTRDLILVGTDRRKVYCLGE